MLQALCSRKRSFFFALRYAYIKHMPMLVFWIVMSPGLENWLPSCRWRQYVFSEKPVSRYKSTWRYKPEDRHQHLPRRENPRSHVHKTRIHTWYMYHNGRPDHCPETWLQHANCPAAYLYPVAVISRLVRTQLIYTARHSESFWSR